MAYPAMPLYDVQIVRDFFMIVISLANFRLSTGGASARICHKISRRNDVPTAYSHIS